MMDAPAPQPSELGIPLGDLWIFGYGSLMWDPGFPYKTRAPALVRGYHRAFCINSNRWRGTPEQPGLVLGLDRGGACRGVAYLVDRANVASTINGLWAREMRRHIYRVKLLRARFPDGEARAFTFVAAPQQVAIRCAALTSNTSLAPSSTSRNWACAITICCAYWPRCACFRKRES